MTAVEPVTESRMLARALVVLSAWVVVQSAAHLVMALGFHSYDSVLDVDRSNGIPDVLSTLLILAGALAAAGLFLLDRRARWEAGALAFALTLLAIDGFAHEEPNLRHPLGRLIALVLVLTTLAVLVNVASLSGTARVALLSGLILMAAAGPTAISYDELMNLTGNPYVGRGDVLA
jgi:hypothetical protein